MAIDGSEVEIAFDEVEKANKIYEFSSANSPARSAK
jgi:hypothetical protein